MASVLSGLGPRFHAVLASVGVDTDLDCVIRYFCSGHAIVDLGELIHWLVFESSKKTEDE